MADFLPKIPNEITVHLGLPSSNAENITVDFINYIDCLMQFRNLSAAFPENTAA